MHFPLTNEIPFFFFSFYLNTKKRCCLLGPFLLPGIGAASSILLIQGAKREVIVRLLVWVGIGIVLYLFYGRRHSEVNNPRLVQDDPMRVLQENFSVDTVNYRGFQDEHLRRQYERQLGRRLGGDGEESSVRISRRESGVVDDGEEYLPQSGTGTPLSRGSSFGGRSPVTGGYGGQEMTEIGIDRLDGTGARAGVGTGGSGVDHVYQQRIQQLQQQQQTQQQQQHQTSDESDGSGVGGSGTGSGTGSGSGSWSRSKSSRSAYVARPSTANRNGSGDTKENAELGDGGGVNEMERQGQQPLDTPHSSAPPSPPGGR